MRRRKRIVHVSPIAGRFVCDSSWEKIFAEWCDANSLSYERNKDSFRYFNITKKRKKISRYYPDFKLSAGLYVEVKGYESIVDKFKWVSFPHKLIILRRKQIEILHEYNIKELMEFVYKKDKSS